MPRFFVTLYRSESFVIESDDEDNAFDIAIDNGLNMDCVNMIDIFEHEIETTSHSIEEMEEEGGDES